MLAEIPVSDVPAVLAELAAVQSALAARLLREPPRTEPVQPLLMDFSLWREPLSDLISLSNMSMAWSGKAVCQLCDTASMSASASQI